MSVDRDFEMAQERHRRQLMLMGEMGKVNRMEMRMYFLWATAGTLGVVALVMAMVF